jgi:hypothetical protein
MEAADPGRRGRTSTPVRRAVLDVRAGTVSEGRRRLDRLLKAREEGPVAGA